MGLQCSTFLHAGKRDWHAGDWMYKLGVLAQMHGFGQLTELPGLAC